VACAAAAAVFLVARGVTAAHAVVAGAPVGIAALLAGRREGPDPRRLAAPASLLVLIAPAMLLVGLVWDALARRLP
jgi:hypothetical protein